MKKIYIMAFLLAGCTWGLRAQVHVISGGEFANFGIIDLSTSTSWSTDRSATPGYFSAIGTASYINATDSNNINGYVKHYTDAANQGLIFPTGDSSHLRSLTTSGTIANASQFAAAWFAGSPGTITDPTDGSTHSIAALGTGISGISVIGFWDWQDLSSTGSGVTITVSIPDVSGFTSATNLRLVGWNGTQWIDLSGAATASGNTLNSTLSGTMQNGITALAIGSAFAGPPDLTPLVDIDDANFASGAERDFIIDVFETGGGTALHATQQIQVRIGRLSAFDITVPGLTLSSTDQSGTSGTSNVGGGQVNENGNWYFRQTASFIYITSKPGTNINANSLALIGLHIKRKTGVLANTSQVLTPIIITGSGGETNATNNNAVTTVTTY